LVAWWVVEDGRVHEEDASREAGGWLALAARLPDTLLVPADIIALVFRPEVQLVGVLFKVRHIMCPE
jgi:hypothetical protein